MRALLAAAKRQRQLAQGLRRYAAAPAVATDDNAFLRFSNPFPQQLNFTPTLGILPETKVTTLPNGLRVASETTPFGETATVGIWIDAGSRFETDANNGAAHFLEHMAFKGTKARTVKQLEQEIENMGGHLNAYTTRESTCFHTRVFSKDVPKAVDILSDILQESNLDESAIERERDVILREMQEVEGIPEEVVFDHLHATAFQYTPLGRTILGPAENVRTLTRDDLADYVATHYTPRRMVVAAAGGVDHDQLVSSSEKAFGNLPKDTVSAGELIKQHPSFFTGSEVRIRDPDMPLVHFAIAFQGASWNDPDAVTLQVMQTMLGTWNKSAGAGINMSSPLAQRVATNELAESFMAFNTNYHDSGLWGVYGVAERDSMEDLCWVMMREVTGMCYSVDPDQVQRAKNQLKAAVLFNRDTTNGIAETIGRELLVYGRKLPLAEYLARIDAVDEGAVKEVANRFIYDQDIAVAALGDTQFMPDYNWLRRRTYWLRY